jgi:DNA mismatch endonuclease (patch repair protein)
VVKIDTVGKDKRKKIMASIKGRNTHLEISFRKTLWNLGIRGYRIYPLIPGTPDLLFVRYKVAVFIDGCFWHVCPTCYTRPKSNQEYWDKKARENRKRDMEVNEKLTSMGYKVIRIWEHDIKHFSQDVNERIKREILFSK